MKKYFLFLCLLASSLLPFISEAHFTRDLAVGMSGADVRELQQLLNRNPRTVVALQGAGAPGYETDYYGLRTRDAVLRFQTLPEYQVFERDGVVAGKTRAVLGQVEHPGVDSYSPAGSMQSGYVPPQGQPTQGEGGGAGNGYGLGGYSPQGYGLGGYGLGGGVGQGVESPTQQQRAAAPNVNLGPITLPGTEQFTPQQQVQPSLYGSLLRSVTVEPKMVAAQQPLLLSFAAESAFSYRLRLDCASGVNASNQFSQELCRSTNLLKGSMSPLSIRFGNSTGVDQQVTLVLTAHDASGNILDLRSEQVTVRPGTTGAPVGTTPNFLSLTLDGVADDGSSVVALPQGSSLAKNVSILTQGVLQQSTYGTQQAQLSVVAPGFPQGQISVSPGLLSLIPGQPQTAQLQINTAGYLATPVGDYRVTVTVTAAQVTQSRSFILRVGGYGSTTTTGLSNSTATLPDLSITYSGLSAATRGQLFAPVFTLREANGAVVTSTAVRATLYDLFYLPSSSAIYGYEPSQFSDSTHVLATNQVSVSSGYSSNTLFPTASYTLYQAGNYKVCASIDTANQLVETSKLNNVACGYVTVQ